MIRRIAHHTRGEAKPLIPVKEIAVSGSATSVAPRFRRNSDTSTQATLKLSCSHGLPNPRGRSRIRFFSVRAYCRKMFRIPHVLVGRATPCAPRRAFGVQRTARPTRFSHSQHMVGTPRLKADPRWEIAGEQGHAASVRDI